MSEGMSRTGIATPEELRASPGYPSEERLRQGRVVVIECVQEIPCNPCEAACHQGAITVCEPITNVPVLHEELCDGCGLCVAQCPGLAIFVVDFNYSPTEALVGFPYEYLPLPRPGQVVDAVNREGVVVAQGRVVRVVNPRANDRTPVVYIAVPKELGMEVRSMRRERVAGSGGTGVTHE